MTNFVLPGEKFYVTYVSDGIEISYAVPDVTAETEDVTVALNGIVQPPYDVFTVHQGNLRFVDGAPISGFVITIRA